MREAAISVPPGYRALVLDEIDSTNEEAKRLAESGETGGLYILARAQTAGRGRRGREWVSPKGNFHATLLLRPKATPERAAQLSFVAANAVAETFEALGAPATQVKWPNDVLIAGMKAAGILLESSARAGALEWLIVGMGLNLAHAPKTALYPATTLKDHIARVPDPIEVLPVLARALARQYEIWAREGFAPMRAAWLSRAAFVGQRITARLESEEIEGLFVDLSDTGALMLETAQGMRAITAGEVFGVRSN